MKRRPPLTKERIIKYLSEPQKELLRLLNKYKDSFIRHSVCIVYDEVDILVCLMDKDSNEVDDVGHLSLKTIECLQRRGILDVRHWSPNLNTDSSEYWVNKEYKPLIKNL